MKKGIFVVGTGTDVGKTYVSGLLVKELLRSYSMVGYYKAAISGNERGNDGELIPHDPMVVNALSKSTQPVEEMCPYVYEKAVSPHLASKLEGNPVDIEVVREGFERVCSNYDFVIMEGSGGIVCPIEYGENEIWLTDIIKMSTLPCLLVADAGLGTINQVVLTIEYMKHKDIKVEGIIFNRFHPGNIMEEDNKYMCEQITKVPVIGYVSENGKNIVFDEEKKGGLLL